MTAGARRRSVQRRFYVGRMAEGGEVIVNKRFSGGGDVRVTLEELRTRATTRATFEAWLRDVAGGGVAAHQFATGHALYRAES